MTPRLFAPENNTKAEEFKQFLPVNVTCSFRSLAPAIAQCETKYLLPVLGEPLFERLAAYYEAGTHDSDLLELLLKRSQYAVVRLAYWQDYDLLSGMVYAISTALGFFLAMVVFAGLREQMELNKTPKAVEGMPLALITAGLLSMAFMGFSGVDGGLRTLFGLN